MSLHSTSAVVKACGVSTRQLYYWEMLGMIQPRYENFGLRKFRRYTDGDIQLVQRAKELLDQGFTLQAVRRRLTTPDEIADQSTINMTAIYPRLIGDDL